ncbi:MAG: phage tail protein [Gammaproteobacteria bacterium]
MGLETATYIEDLVDTNPLGSDNVNAGDDHIRLIKEVLQAQFPNLGQAAVNLQASSINAMIGMVGAFAAAPAGGWLLCDGSAVSRTTYAALFAIISDDYGAGDGSTTFNLPDYRGEFLRGVDGGAGVDPDAASRTDRGDTTTGDAVGTRQADDLASHTHTVGRSNSVGTSTVRLAEGSSSSGTTATSATGGNETRPTNVGVLFYILAK